MLANTGTVLIGRRTFDIEIEEWGDDGERNVCVMGGASLGQQVLAAGLADELRIHVAPVLLGTGTRLFEQRVELERAGIVETAAATHLTFRVAR
jgi:dihydrofolate reductase